MTGTATTKDSLPHADPEAVGMSSAPLARIVPALNAEIEAGQLPDALFAIASMTKPVTGVAGLLLWEEGRKDRAGRSDLPYPHRSFTGWNAPASPGALITESVFRSPARTPAAVPSH
jgi:hypothetical protein